MDDFLPSVSGHNAASGLEGYLLSSCDPLPKNLLWGWEEEAKQWGPHRSANLGMNTSKGASETCSLPLHSMKADLFVYDLAPIPILI
ncbi:hypothetical protein CEXT_193781 [Caerostris extrusa]|uniref:Uncharacterized protein n=1 Tax=Caerostris extrusa TaxID=172846 RepID=A0AAV4VWQ6_CAEEX|nr:hypothetical protein CEXT_193781 [Caerostris extrusa]